MHCDVTVVRKYFLQKLAMLWHVITTSCAIFVQMLSVLICRSCGAPVALRKGYVSFCYCNMRCTVPLFWTSSSIKPAHSLPHERKKVRVKCTIVRALRVCTGRTAQRGSRGIALLFWPRHWTGWGVSVTPRPILIPGKNAVPIVHEAGWAPGPVWTGGKSRPYWDSILGPSRP